MPALRRNAVVFCLGLVFWSSCFFGCWWFFPRRQAMRARWQSWSTGERYNAASLLHSTLHGVIIPIGIIVCLSDCGIWGDWVANSCTQIEIVFALTASYFAMDTLLIVCCRGDKWPVFLAHHLVGSMPFFINCFGCSNLHYLVGCGILIEAICPLLNLRSWLQIKGKGETTAAAWAFVALYVAWAGIRVALPIYLTTGMFSTAVLGLRGKILAWALYPSFVTGICITVFCIGVFLFVLSFEVPWAYRILRRGGDSLSDLEGHELTGIPRYSQQLESPSLPSPHAPSHGAGTDKSPESRPSSGSREPLMLPSPLPETWTTAHAELRDTEIGIEHRVAGLHASASSEALLTLSDRL